MEIYYKDLISEDESLEQLVDDLVLLVHGVDDLARATQARLDPKARDEIVGRLVWLKKRLRSIKAHASASARATDRAVRAYPYSFLAAAFSLGLLVAVAMRRPGLGRKRH